MVTPQSWSLHGHEMAARYFIGNSPVEIFQEAACWFALEEIEELMGLQYNVNVDENDEVAHSITVFYDEGK